MLETWRCKQWSGSWDIAELSSCLYQHGHRCWVHVTAYMCTFCKISIHKWIENGRYVYDNTLSPSRVFHTHLGRTTIVSQGMFQISLGMVHNRRPLCTRQHDNCLWAGWCLSKVCCLLILGLLSGCLKQSLTIQILLIEIGTIIKCCDNWHALHNWSCMNPIIGLHALNWLCGCQCMRRGHRCAV